MTAEQVKRDVILAAQPTKEFVTVEEVAALAVYPLLPTRRSRSPARCCRSTAAGRRRERPRRGLAGMPTHRARRSATRRLKTINLALQGGGAHGAFTWGVLDRLIEDGRLDFEAISGTSAGAMNAVVLADGFDARRRRWRPRAARGLLAGRQRARACGGAGRQRSSGRSSRFWNAAELSEPARLFQRLRRASPRPTASTRSTSIRCATLLEELVDFDRVRANDGLKLFISATNVRNGKIKVFSGNEITADAVMASACLPYLFQAVEIDGEAYWDGGYMGNPALFPFFTETRVARTSSSSRSTRSAARRCRRPAQEIMERVSEITFNASLLARIPRHRLRQPADRREPARPEALQAEPAAPHRRDRGARRPHRLLEARHELALLQELRDAGREAAEDWLKRHYDDIGVKATLDLRKEFM